jgi:hypothetical protein
MKRSVQLLMVMALCASYSYAQSSEQKVGVFDARHELKVIVPEGAKKVRIWFTLPQDVSQQKVANLKVESPFPYRIERDKTEGSRFLYVEAIEPKVKEFTPVTTFRLTRKEVLNDLNPAKAGRFPTRIERSWRASLSRIRMSSSTTISANLPSRSSATRRIRYSPRGRFTTMFSTMPITG